MDNETRAQNGHAAVKAGAPDYGYDGLTERMVTTVANILHLACAQEIDIDKILALAKARQKEDNST